MMMMMMMMMLLLLLLLIFASPTTRSLRTHPPGTIICMTDHMVGDMTCRGFFFPLLLQSSLLGRPCRMRATLGGPSGRCQKSVVCFTASGKVYQDLYALPDEDGNTHNQSLSEEPSIVCVSRGWAALSGRGGLGYGWWVWISHGHLIVVGPEAPIPYTTPF
ncbi:hypothetical protein BO71DRAFT_393744 [Aspergillus ellipticus CBS 707.79]|uniref:Secreted protein n=1 Tax=Aspergillus ellipticus CBS 707.79 TaxID=1448320 RepID=A0A319E8X0_9EURO|nr:hypothetical protein BO71DRAFT_393744 [Aspergillus ellipticus CBS 707.79]